MKHQLGHTVAQLTGATKHAVHVSLDPFGNETTGCVEAELTEHPGPMLYFAIPWDSGRVVIRNPFASTTAGIRPSPPGPDTSETFDGDEHHWTEFPLMRWFFLRSRISSSCMSLTRVTSSV